MTSANVADYINAMKSCPVTQNWDAAVSYNEAKINKLLADRFSKNDASGMVQDISVSFDDEDRVGKYTQYYHFKLGAPLIQFDSTTARPTCVLTLPIASGETWTSDDSTKKSLLENTYNIVLSSLQLGAVKGSSFDKDSPHLLPTPGSEIETRIICINFTSSTDATVKVERPKDDDNLPMKNSQLPTALQSYFLQKVTGVKYELANITNSAPSSGVLDLVPKAFIFVTFVPVTSSTDDTSVPGESSLTLLIQTRGSDEEHGDTTNVQASWITTWTNIKVAPIPHGHTASIIINNSFFMQKYIKIALTKLNMTNLNELSIDGGLQVTGNWPQPLTRDELTKRDTVEDPAPVDKTFYEYDVPKLQFDPNKGGDPFKLTFGQANGTDNPGTIEVKWSYGFGDTWSGGRYWREYSSAEMAYVTRFDSASGSYNVVFSLIKSTDTSQLDNQSFSLAIGATDSDWTYTVTNTSDTNIWSEILQVFHYQNNAKVPEWVTNALPRISFNIDFHTLRFFSITNVFFPGKTVINVDLASGLRFPRDVVIIGDVVDDVTTRSPILKIRSFD